MTSRLSAFEASVLHGLASRAGIAARLLDAWAELPQASPQTAASITAKAQLGVTEERGAQEILSVATQLGLLVRVGDGYVPSHCSTNVLRRFATGLFAIEHYRAAVHRDATTAQVVLTKPPRPCVLEDELANLGWRTSDLEPTEDAFRRMAQQAESRVVVMTPFFDVTGALWLKEFFSLTQPAVKKVLILRSLGEPERQDYPLGFDAISPWLAQERVEVFNYSITRYPNPGRETFHAKVILCDDEVAYVGSSNLNAASLEHSMELGVAMVGKGARDVATIVQAVLKSATRLF